MQPFFSKIRISYSRVSRKSRTGSSNYSSGSNNYNGSDGEDGGMCLLSASYKPDTVYLRGCPKE